MWQVWVRTELAVEQADVTFVELQYIMHWRKSREKASELLIDHKVFTSAMHELTNIWAETVRRVLRAAVTRDKLARSNIVAIPARMTVISKTCSKAAPLLFFHIQNPSVFYPKAIGQNKCFFHHIIYNRRAVQFGNNFQHQHAG